MARVAQSLTPSVHRIGHELVLHTVDARGAAVWTPAIVELVRASFDEVVDSLDAAAVDDANVLDSLVGFQSLEDCVFLLVEHALPVSSQRSPRALVAFAVVAQFSRALYVANLCTHPSARGRGVASTLLYECHDLAYERGLDALCGTVEGERSDLRGFYGALGASVVSDAAFGSAGAPRHMRLTRPVRPAEVGVRGVCARQGPRLLRRIPLPVGAGDAAAAERAPSPALPFGALVAAASVLHTCTGFLLRVALDARRRRGRADGLGRSRSLACLAGIGVAVASALALGRSQPRARLHASAHG